MKNNVFDAVKLSAPNYNWFDLSHDSKLTLDIGNLVPVLVTRAYAGERFKVGLEQLTRFAPMLAPVFNRFDVRFDSFFYPTRLVWEKSGDFFRGGKSGNEDIPYPQVELSKIINFYIDEVSKFIEGHPVHKFDNNSSDNSETEVPANRNNVVRPVHKGKVSNTDNGGYRRISGTDVVNVNVLSGRNPLVGTLYDYLGLPTFDDIFSKFLDEEKNISDAINKFKVEVNKIVGDRKIDIIPFVMYQGIYREYYADQQFNLFFDNFGDAYREFAISNKLLSVCLPDVDLDDILLNLNTSLKFDNTNFAYEVLLNLRRANYSRDYFNTAHVTPSLSTNVRIPLSNLEVTTKEWQGNLKLNKTGNIGFEGSATTDDTGLIALGGTNSTTIPDLRRANKLQEFLDRSMLGGNRFIEWIKAHFGVTSSDARLNIPEFLGRSKMPVTISSVTQTMSDNEKDVFLGDMAGQGISVHGDKLFDYTCEEPGYFFVLMSIVPRQSYFQGLPKLFSKFDRFDFLIPEFSEIGEQTISTDEIYLTKNPKIFGYQSRYSEYKFLPNEIHGDFKGSLSYWHDSRIFNKLPVLSQRFLEVNDNDGLNRIFAYVGDKEKHPYSHILTLLQFNIQALRPLPIYNNYRL